MKKFFKILFFIILLSILILWLAKIFLLTHKYQVKYYNEDKIEKDIVITFNGIYGYEKQLRFIDEKLAEDGYTVVNIQYPSVNENIAEMTEKYIAPKKVIIKVVLPSLALSKSGTMGLRKKALISA